MVPVLFCQNIYIPYCLNYFFFFTGGDHVSDLVLSSAQENGGKRSFMFSNFFPQKKCTDLRMNTEEFYCLHCLFSFLYRLRYFLINWSLKLSQMKSSIYSARGENPVKLE